MLARIIVGIIIGAIAGFFLSKQSTSSVAVVFIGLIVIAFIASSFMFGAIFGLMAIGEIVVGYWISSAMQDQAKPGEGD